MKMHTDQKLYIYSMGKRLRVTAIFHDVDAANAYLKATSDEGVIAECSPYIFIANLYDNGTEATYG